jgi:hypothetical protein
VPFRVPAAQRAAPRSQLGAASERILVLSCRPGSQVRSLSFRGLCREDPRIRSQQLLATSAADEFAVCEPGEPRPAPNRGLSRMGYTARNVRDGCADSIAPRRSTNSCVPPYT